MSFQLQGLDYFGGWLAKELQVVPPVLLDTDVTARVFSGWGRSVRGKDLRGKVE